VAVNFDAVLRLVAKVDGLQNIDKLQGALGGLEGTAKKARRAFTDVTSSATWQAAAVGAAAIGAGLVSSVRTAMDFEAAMSGVAAKVGGTDEEVKMLATTARELGKDTQFSAKQAAEGMDFLAMAGFNANEIISAMPGLLDLAAAGSLELGTAADITSNILGGMNMEASETGRVADVLAKAANTSNVSVEMLGETFKYVAPVAAQAGVSLEELAAASGLLGDAGIQASEAGTGLRSVLLRLAAPPDTAAGALKALGVSTKDASGNMRPFGDILRDVDQSMRDMNLGTAEVLEMQNNLYGKTAIASGAILQQAAAAGQLTQKTAELTDIMGYSSEVAQKMNDNLAGAFKRLNSAWEELQLSLLGEGGSFLQVIVDGLAKVLIVVGNLAKEFPILTGTVVALAAAFVALVAAAPFIAAFISVIGSLKAAVAGVALGATVAGWLGALLPALAGIVAAFKAAVGAILLLFTGPVGLTALAIAAVVAMAVAFREPIMRFFSWLGGAVVNGIKVLWAIGEPVRQFWAGVWDRVAGLATAFFTTLGKILDFGLKAAYAIVWQLWVQPWINLWQKVLREPITAMLEWIGGVFKGIGDVFTRVVAEPITRAWSAVAELLPRTMRAAADFVQRVWTGMVENVKGAVRGLLQFVANAVNSVGQLINQLIASFNALPGPDIPFVPTFTIPKFAKGGTVDRPTLAMIGEGGEREYVIPESKMQSASSRFLGGARGAAVIPSSGAGGGAGAGAANLTLNVTTGPVMQAQDGQRYVLLEDFEDGMRQVGDAVLDILRSPQARIALGGG
jgi:TP901 family phage tail tape measure protein